MEGMNKYQRSAGGCATKPKVIAGPVQGDGQERREKVRSYYTNTLILFQKGVNKKFKTYYDYYVM